MNGCLPQSQWQITADPNCPGMGGDAFLSAFMSEVPSSADAPKDPVLANETFTQQALFGSSQEPGTFIGFVPAPSVRPPAPVPGLNQNMVPQNPFGETPNPVRLPPGSGFTYEPPAPPPSVLPELAPELPFIGTLGALGLFGLAGITTSLAVGAPAPDEYGIQDLEALIASGFYGNLVPQYQPPDNPAQTELAPAVAPALEPAAPETVTIPGVTITAPPIPTPNIPIFVTPPFEAQPYVPIPGTNPIGLPVPGRTAQPLPGPSTGPATAPVGAPAPVAGVSPLPTGLPLQSPSPSTTPAASPNTPASYQLTQGSRPPAPAPDTNPLTQTQPQLQPAPTKPALALLTVPEQLGAVPTSSSSKQDCKPSNKQQQKQQKKKRKDRTVCHAGTYIERKHGLSKHSLRTVPCR